ncbi:zinc finger, CCHC-type containing protein [Tanacetum coccineum]
MEKGFLTAKGRWSGKGVKEKHDSVGDVRDMVLCYADSGSVTSTVKAMVKSLSDTLSNNNGNVNTSIVNIETPLESNKGDDVTSNVNVEPSTSASLLAFMSFTTLLKGDISQKSVNFRTLTTPERNGVDVAFSSKDGLDAMLENGPYFIRNNPSILKKWDPDVNLLKKDVGNVSVLVKLYGVPITTFSEDELSSISTKLGTPLMLDSYTSDMCMHSWGRSSYAQAMIELQADAELKDTIIVAMPKIIGEGFYMCTIRVEYEWKPPSSDEEVADDAGKKNGVGRKCMTRSSSNELYTPYKDAEREFRSSRRHFKSQSFNGLRSSDFDLLSDQENSEEEEEAMAETMEQYMSNTRTDYESGVELRENTFSGSDNEDANEYIEKVLEIVDLFHIPNITENQLMLRVFPISLTGATSCWLGNKPTGSITTWEDLKTKFLNKYCPPGRTAKKMEEINSFQQEPDETLISSMGTL